MKYFIYFFILVMGLTGFLAIHPVPYPFLVKNFPILFKNTDDPQTERQLAAIYFSEDSGEANNKKAIEWETRAANHGDTEAMVNLGHIYKGGRRVAQDYKMAFKWFSKAAEKGDLTAVSELGDLYYDGKGVEKNISKALDYYYRVPETILPHAKYAFGRRYYMGDQVEKDYNKALYWLIPAAKSGNRNAQILLDYMRQTGLYRSLGP